VTDFKAPTGLVGPLPKAIRHRSSCSCQTPCSECGHVGATECFECRECGHLVGQCAKTVIGDTCRWCVQEAYRELKTT
jgi:hypothetical protein